MDSEFEQRLRRQAVKPVPAEWRAEILAVAQREQTIHHSTSVIRPSWFSTLNPQLSAFFWPHPTAWAGIAAAWICIFALNFSTREPATTAIVEKPAPPSLDAIVALRRQQKLLVELIGPSEVRGTDGAAWLPSKPRSKRDRVLAA